MIKPPLLALTATTLLAAGPALAGPNCKKNCPEHSLDEQTYSVIERDGEARPERGERGERPERGERGERDRRHHPRPELDLTEEQKEAAQAIREAAREQAQAIREDVKTKREAGEELDREAIREQLMAIRKAAMEDVYNNVLNDEQRAKVDEHREKMEERRAERRERGEGEERERSRRPRRERGGEEFDL